MQADSSLNTWTTGVNIVQLIVGLLALFERTIMQIIETLIEPSKKYWSNN